MSSELSPTSALLVQGGDHRLDIQPGSHLNKYGCQPFPCADRIDFGSSTASQISAPAFRAADSLRLRIAAELAAAPAADVYHAHFQRLRTELLAACALPGPAAPDLIFAASGTDAHLIAARLLAAGTQKSLRVIMVNPEESGSGVSAALSEGCGGGNGAPDAAAPEIVHVPLRHTDGAPRTCASIDADVDFLAESALQAGLDVLLVLIDVSKTGCVAPSPRLAGQLQRDWPARVHVLVDACQFRIETATLRAYLQDDFMVAITGSKFVGGPSFSSALLLPPPIAAALRPAGAPPQLRACSVWQEWPDGWDAGRTLPSCQNMGLLLRWEAALCELRALGTISGDRIRHFLQRFGTAVQQRLQSDAHFAPLPSPALPGRGAGLIPQWDDVQTIHAFILYRPLPHRRPLDRAALAALYLRLQQTPHGDGCVYLVGQPVACGRREGIDIGALRLCVSARMIVQACSGAAEDNAGALIGQAMACLDAIAALIAEQSIPLEEKSEYQVS
jgi:hypothetical protein